MTVENNRKNVNVCSSTRHKVIMLENVTAITIILFCLKADAHKYFKNFKDLIQYFSESKQVLAKEFLKKSIYSRSVSEFIINKQKT